MIDVMMMLMMMGCSANSLSGKQIYQWIEIRNEHIMIGANMIETNTTNDPRDRALELVENGFVSTLGMLSMCLKYMSTDDVIDMLECNELANFDDDAMMGPQETMVIEGIEKL